MCVCVCVCVWYPRLDCGVQCNVQAGVLVREAQFSVRAPLLLKWPRVVLNGYHYGDYVHTL